MRVLRRGMGGPDVKQWQEFLRQQGFDIGTPDGSFGERTFRATVEFQSRNGLGSDGVVGPGTVSKAAQLGFVEAEGTGGSGGGGGGGESGGGGGGSTGGSGGLTEQALAQIMPNLNAAKRAAYFPHLSRAMEEFEINTPARQAAFLAQLAHESAEFRFMEEIWGPTAAQRRYEGRRDLGNTQAGDGFRFKGRGPIQLTGRHNYTIYGQELGVDLVNNPQAAATPEVGFRVAGLYWKKNNINAKADRQDIVAITRAINGGVNGLEDRKRYYEKARRVLGVSSTRGVGASVTRGEEEEDGPRFTRGLDAPGETVPTAAERNASQGAAKKAAAPSGASKGGAKGGAKKAAKGGAKKAAAKKAGKKSAGKAAKKAASKKSAVKKAAGKKSASKKSASKKSAAPRGGGSKKGAGKKGAASKKAAKKGASKKSSGKSAAKKGGGRRGSR